MALPFSFSVPYPGFSHGFEEREKDLSPAHLAVLNPQRHLVTSRYPQLEGLREEVTRPVVLDGEIVAFDEDGRLDFAALWFRSRGSSHRPICFMAFDVLHVDGADLLDKPYRERRKILEGFELDGPHWCTPDIHIGGGRALLEATRQMGLEGVVAKRVDSVYRPGLRSKAWIKTKHFQTRTFSTF